MLKALIVDDSKTARYSLRQLLERVDFEVDALESAEEALDYLKEQRPDLIFMDHMMPGMDGFQAVKTIKGEPRVADIPIVMYTSREGEVYVGQAHALGAADIMIKPARQKDLTSVLDRLRQRHLLQPAIEAKLEPVEPVPAAGATESVASVEVVEPAIDENEGPLPEEPPPLAETTARNPWWVFAAVVALLLPVAWLLNLYIPAEQERRQLVDQQRQLYRVLQWSLNQENLYPWGASPLAGERLARFRELISQLSALGYEGRVRLKVHAGDFCLVGDGDGGWQLPPADLAVTECGALGVPALQAMALTQRQGSAFTRFLERSPLLADGRIRVEWLGYGSATPREDYPVDEEDIDAGRWNDVAGRNQRYEIELLPDARPDQEGLWSLLKG